VGSETVALLLEVSRLELDTAAGAETEHGHPRSPNSVLLVGGVLRKRICGAKRRIEGTREGLLAHAVGLLVVELVSAALGLRAAGQGWWGVGLLVVTVGADDNNLKTALSLALV
jgi:hypothetical protein